jgi:type VI secretion system FHA domain protein
MLLKLEVVGAEAGRLGERRSKIFAAEGGTIGRIEGNDWVLPDQYVSSRHAAIRCVDGQFFVIDTNSSNGVSLNTPGYRLEQGRPYAIKTGDRLLIDPFEIHVSVIETMTPRGAVAQEPQDTVNGQRSAAPPPQQPHPAPQSDPFAVLEEVPPVGTLQSPSLGVHGESLIAISELDEELPVDPLLALGLPDSHKKAPNTPRAEHLASGSPLHSHFEPPRVTPAKPANPVGPAAKTPSEPAPLIPQGYNPLIQTGFDTDTGKSVPSPSGAPRLPRSESSASRPKLVQRQPEVAPPPKAAAPAARPSPAAPPSPAARPAPRSAPPAPPPPIPKFQPELRARPAAPPPAAPSPPPAAVQQAVPAGAAAEGHKSLDFAALLAAAGLEGVPVTSELSATFGSILKVVIDGLRDVLRAREELKEQFRMRITTYQPRENNPIKFSANTPDALHNLLVKRNSAYLGPVAAFEEAFVDLRIHQMAMLAGLRAAYEAMLRTFDPDMLEGKFERYSKRGGLLAGAAKQRYWELYRDSFEDLVRDADSSFQNLFGEAFSKAYEEQAQLLKRGALGQ